MNTPKENAIQLISQLIDAAPEYDRAENEKRVKQGLPVLNGDNFICMHLKILKELIEKSWVENQITNIEYK